MTNTTDLQFNPTPRARKLLTAALVLASALAAAAGAPAQSITTPHTSTDITPPVGNTAFLVGHAQGTQGYVCLPKGTGASWTVNSARPEASLFQSVFGLDVQIITHFLSPNTNPIPDLPKPLPFANATWQSSLDTSKVWAQAVGNAPAGSEPACPNSGAIACLLLQTVGTQQGPTGGKSLVKTSFIQRLNTKGGSAPEDGCIETTDVGKQTLVPYSADYFFFRKN